MPQSRLGLTSDQAIAEGAQLAAHCKLDATDPRDFFARAEGVAEVTVEFCLRAS